MECGGGVIGVVAPSQVKPIKRSDPSLIITSLHYFLPYVTTRPLSQARDKLLQPLHNPIPLGTRTGWEAKQASYTLIVGMQVTRHQK